MFLVSDGFWTRPFHLIATHPLRISPFPFPSEKKGIFFLPLPSRNIPKIKGANTAAPLRNNFQDPAEILIYWEGGGGGGYSMEGGIPYERDGDLCQKIRILLNPLKANNLGSYIIFWPISPKQYHYGLKLYWHSVLDTLSEVKLAPIWCHFCMVLLPLPPTHDPNTLYWYARDTLSYYNFLLLGRARFQNLSMIWKLLLTLQKDIHYLEK